ncbi:pilus assembly protein TadG-related protein [Novosphingobium endophyticum]|nr:pilus assembly protein TadG-related protein [Novosphingobium endophyticum]
MSGYSPVNTGWKDRRGAVSVLSALSLPCIIGFVSLAVEVGNGYAVHIRNQAIADTAALSAAQAYLVNEKNAEWEGAAREAVAAAGLSADAVAPALVDSPDGSGAQAIKAVVTTQQPYFFSRMFNLGSSFTIRAAAYAKLPGETAPCIIALAQGSLNGVEAARGSGIDAADCAIHTNANVYASGSSSISSNSISAHGTISRPPNESAITASLMGEGADVVSDPLAGNAAIATALSTTGTYTAVQLPHIAPVPTVSASCSNARFERTWWPANGYFYKNGGTSIGATLEGDTWVFPAGTYEFDDLSVGEKIAFDGPTTINVNKSITMVWPSITIRGDGVVNVGKNVENVAGLTITGNGIVNVGGNAAFGGWGDGLKIGGSAELNVAGNVSTGAGFSLGDGGSATVNIAGNLTVSNYFISGDGDLAVAGRTTVQGSARTTVGNGRHYFGPIETAGSTALTVGDGDTDVNGKLTVGDSSTVRFGDGAFAIVKDVSGDGLAIQVGGSSSLAFGSGPFSANGGIKASGTVTFGATASHYINGDLVLGNNTTFGAGAYYINGGLTNATAGSMTGTDVSFILAGHVTISGAAALNLTAATTSSTGALKEMLIVTTDSRDTVIEGAGGSVLSGIIYVPNSALEVRYGGTLSGGGKCWSLVAQTVYVHDGAGAATSACSALSDGSGGASTSISLVR